LVTKNETGYEVRYLVQDNDSHSPDELGDDGLFLVHYHRDFWIERNDIISREDLGNWYRGYSISQSNDYFIYPVAALIHSGVYLSFGRNFNSDPGGWDTSHVGAILVSKKEFKTKNKAFKAAECLLGEWNMYLSGDVYGCVVERFDSLKEHIDHDSCWGFFGFECAKEELVDFNG
jgi:hypothetical protein